MTLRTLSLAAAAFVTSLSAATFTPAQATEIRSGAGNSVELGPLAGVAYYTPDAQGYHVVVTLAPRGAAPALRFETTLASDQSVTLSTPRMADEPATSVKIARNGDRVFVSKAGLTEVAQEADATH